MLKTSPLLPNPATLRTFPPVANTAFSPCAPEALKGDPATAVSAPEEPTENMLTPAEPGTASRPPAGLNAARPAPFTLCGEPTAAVRAPEAPTEKMYRDSPALTSSRFPLGLNVTDPG